MRSANINDIEARQLGLEPLQASLIDTPGKAPLLKLAAVFNRRLIRHTRETPFPLDALDDYNINIIAPDYLLTGLMKGALYCTFSQLSTDTERDILQLRLKASLLEFGFQSQTLLFKDKKLVPGLSMSMIYAIFSVLPTLLKSMGLLDKLPTRHIIIHLHTFMCLGFW